MSPLPLCGPRSGLPASLPSTCSNELTQFRYSRSALITLASLFICSLTFAAPAPVNMVPIAVTGWNKDVVIESTAIGPPYTAYATEMNTGEGTCFYATGLYNYQWGLPPSGQFVSLFDGTTIFQIPP